MSLSFSSLWEQMEEKTPLMTSGLDSQVLTVIRAGEDLHGEDENSFWDEFISLCSNRQGLADLLDISPEKIGNWPARIKDYQEKLKKHKIESPHEEEDKNLMPTGDNGAVTTNQDPYLGEM